MGENAIGAFAQGHNGTRIEDQHIAARTAAAAVAADGDADLFGLPAESQRTGHTEAAGATPAADALGQDAVGQIPFGFNPAGIVNNHQTAHSAGAAVAAHGKTDGGFLGDAAGNTEPAVTATAADTLGEDAVSPVALGMVGGAIADERHFAAVGPAAALATNADLNRGRLADAAGNTEPAGTAAAADALGDERVRIIAGRKNAAGVFQIHTAAATAAGTVAAHAETD